MTHHNFIVDLAVEIHELPHVDMVNGAEKHFDTYEFDENLISDRLRENQEFIIAAKEYGFSEDDLNKSPFRVLSKMYYDGDTNLIEDEECWNEAEEAFKELVSPVLTKLFNELHDYLESQNAEINEFTIDKDYFKIDFTYDNEDDTSENNIEKIISRYTDSLGGEIFYTFYEKHTNIILCQLKLSDDFVKRALL